MVFIYAALARGWVGSIVRSVEAENIVCAKKTIQELVVVQQTEGIARQSKASCRRLAYRGAA